MTAKIIVIATPKGGAGKTTVSINLGACLGDALLIDTDPSQSAVKWSDAAEDGSLPLAVMGFTGTKVADAIRKVVERFKYILVDTPPSALSMGSPARSALLAADLVIVPVVPSPIDIREAVEITPFLDEINEIRKSGGVSALKARLLVNKLKSGTTFGAEIKEALQGVGIPVFKAVLHEREAHKHAALDGVSVLQIRGDAGTEVEQLAAEVRRII